MASSQRPVQTHVLRDFTFQDGTTLPEVRLAYYDSGSAAAASGKASQEKEKTAVIFTFFRGRIANTPTLADTALQGYRIIVLALFGNGESASPSNTPGFPSKVSYVDCVNAQHQLLTKHLGLDGVDVIMGFSMGGQCAYHWLALHPGFVRQGAIIQFASARTSLHNRQFLEGPRAALENAVDYAPGAVGDKRPVRGIHAFGKAYSAWLTSAAWFDQEKFKELGFATYEDWDAKVTSASGNYLGWEADDLLCMVRMWQSGDISTAVGSPQSPVSLEEALGRIQTLVLLMPCQTDQYFRWEASEREAKSLPKATLAIVPSVWGHAVGLGASKEDNEWMNKAIVSFLNQSGDS